MIKTLPKAQQTRGLRSAYQSNLFRSYHKFKHKSWSNFKFRISTKHQLQNLDQTSASWLNLKFKILTKPSFKISTKIQLHNFYKTSATVTTSTSFESASSHARVTSIKSTKRDGVSQLVRDKDSQYMIELGSDKKEHKLWRIQHLSLKKTIPVCRLCNMHAGLRL